MGPDGFIGTFANAHLRTRAGWVMLSNVALIAALITLTSTPSNPMTTNAAAAAAAASTPTDLDVLLVVGDCSSDVVIEDRPSCAACGRVAPLVDSECPDCRH